MSVPTLAFYSSGWTWIHLYLNILSCFLLNFVSLDSPCLLPHTSPPSHCKAFYPDNYPDRRIFLTDRESKMLYTIPYDSNTLTCQSASTNNTPKGLLHVPVTWTPYLIRTYSLCLRLCNLHLCSSHNRFKRC